MGSKKKYWVSSLIILIAFGFLILNGLKSSMMSYVNVRELEQLRLKKPARTLQVVGIVQPGSIKKVSSGNEIRFLLQDMENPDITARVIYSGIIPDNFKPGIQIVIQGVFNKDEGLLHAEQIFVKCPSKYEANQ